LFKLRWIMDVELLEDQIQAFFDFINERHAIYLRRKRGDGWPWTEDSILQTYKFTNVFRQLDTGTQWYTKNIAKRYANHPELYFMTCFYRLFNWWPTMETMLNQWAFNGLLADYMMNWDPKFTYHALMEHKEATGRVFTNAHMIHSARDMNKCEYMVYHVLDQVWAIRRSIEPTPIDNLESSFIKLLSQYGFGNFVAYEVITDLRHTRYLCNAGDIMTWANPGPGAQRGVCRMAGFTVTTRNYHTTPEDRKSYPKREGYIAVMKYLLDISPVYMEKWVPPLEMRDIEHSLCEFDKHQRVLYGEGTPRMKFVPPHLRK
jgi:hypothetical protein